MCVVDLNVSTLPCRHRWYHLVRPCSPATNLSTCTGRLGIEGWETKCTFCPYCSGAGLNEAEWRLIGNDSSPSMYGGLSRTPSISLNTTRRDSRSGSIARTDSSTSMTMMIAGEKNRALNSRLEAYLSGNQLTRTSSGGEGPESVEEEDEDSLEEAQEQGQRTPPAPGSGGLTMALRNGSSEAGMWKKGWKKSKRFSVGLFK